MKAMILAAGRGNRLKPLTDRIPKSLVRVGGKSLLEHHIKKLATARFESIVINTAHLGEQIHKAIGDGSQYGIPIVYSDEGEHALETGGGIANALPLLGNDPFLVISADIYCEISLDSKFLLGDSLMHVVMVDNPAHNPKGDFNAAELNLPNNGNQRYTYSGIAYLHPKLFTHERRIFPLIETIKTAIANKTISASVYNGAWFDVGTGTRLHEANVYALHKK